MDTFLQDLRLAFRSAARRPLLGIVAAVSLAIGIGANTAIFSAVNRILLRPPDGVQEPERVVELGIGANFSSWSYPDFLDVRAGAAPLEELAAYDFQAISLSQGGGGVRTFGMIVSANYFRVFGTLPSQGRLFRPGEDVGLGEHRVAVVSHDFWMSRLGGDPGVIGSTVRLNRETFEIVGVTRPEFRGHVIAFQPEIYVPMTAYPLLQGSTGRFESRGISWFQVVGRLRADATVDQAQAAVNAVFAGLADEYPDTNAERFAWVTPLSSVPAEARAPVTGFLAALFGLVVFVLLITCANVAGMFLARAGARRREMAIRLSLGAGRGRLIKSLLTESFLVFVLGGLGGVILAYWGLGFISAFDLPAPVPVVLDLTPDGRVLSFALILTMGSGLVFGLLPALQATRMELVPTLKDEGNRPGSASGRLRRFFVTSQVALCLVLLVSAGLFLRSLQRANKLETGFEAAGAYQTQVDLTIEGYQSEQGLLFQDQILNRLQLEPWVEAVALASDLPLDMGRSAADSYPEEVDPEDFENAVMTDFNRVSANYFTTLRIPILEGRSFLESDNAESEAVAIVSRTWAERVWPGEQAVGRRVHFWGMDRTIVGVVEDTKNQMVTDSQEPMIYVALAQGYDDNFSVVVRSDRSSTLVAGELRRILLEVDPTISLAPVLSLETVTSAGVLPQRIAAGLTSVLGLLALLLSGMGIYGVIAHSVALRTREIGIRMALGAERAGVIRLVLNGGLRLAGPGLIVGLVMAMGLGRLLQAFLLGLSPADPMTLLGVAAVLSVMVLVATLVPARRAADVHPAEALRYD